MSGSKILKITGIIMIIFGAITVGISILGLIGATALISMGSNPIILYLASIVVLISGVVQLLAGIKGYKGHDDPSMADTCFKWGIALIALSLLGTVLNFASTGSLDFKNIAMGMILPGLYTYGAYLNKQMKNRD